MTLAVPQIASATGFWNAGNSTGAILTLLNNAGGYGWVSLQVGNNDNGQIVNTNVSCRDMRVGLYQKILLPTSIAFNFGFSKAYNCSTDTYQNCTVTPPTCSQPILKSSFIDFPIYAADFSYPPMPTGLSVTEGDRYLEFLWNNDPNLFSYRLLLKNSSGDVIDDGYLPSDRKLYRFDNLTNGVSYTLNLYPYNHSDSLGYAASITGTPKLTCTPPTCSMTVN